MRMLALLFALMGMVASETLAQKELQVDSMPVESAKTVNLPDLDSIAPPQNTSQKPGFRCSFMILNNLAKAAEIIQEGEAFDCLNSSLVMQEFNRKNSKRIFNQAIATATASTEVSGSISIEKTAFSPFEMADFSRLNL